MANCPKCKKALSFWEIFFSSNPGNIKCRNCKNLIHINNYVSSVITLLAIISSIIVVLGVLEFRGSGYIIALALACNWLLLEYVYFILIKTGIVPSAYTQDAFTCTPISAVTSWLQKNAPELEKNFKQARSANEIENIESQLSVVFPKDVRLAYLEFDGEEKDSDGIFGLWRWLPLDEVSSEYGNLNLISPGALKIPILLSPGGDILYVLSGESSKVYECHHEEPEKMLVVSSSFSQYLLNFCEKLHSGSFLYLPSELNGLVSENEL